MDRIIAISVAVIAVMLTVIAAVTVIKFVYENQKRAKVEGKVIADSKRLVWRITNCGVRNISVVEIGIRCNDSVASHRPLHAATEDINNIPQLLCRGEIASYRKEAERFNFKQSEIDELKKSNPPVYFYVKDAEGKTYECKSELNFVQYLTMLMGGAR